jgi:hypothetical protein
MAMNDILLKRAQNILGLLLGDCGYEVAPASVGHLPFFIVSNKHSCFAVVLSMKTTLKAARAGGNDFKELQKLLTMRVLQVNAFCGAKKASVVLVAPSVLQLTKTMVGRDNLTVETLPEKVDIEYVLDPLRDYDPTREIVARWSIEQLHDVRPDLTDAEAWQVLERAYIDRHDGINLPYLKSVADYMFVPRTLPCTLYPAGDEAHPVPGLFELSTGAVMTQADVDDYNSNEGYTHINGQTGRVTQVRADTPPTAGEFTLEAFGDERFAAPDGFIGDYPNDETACMALRLRLEKLGPLSDITRKFEAESDED